MIVLRLYLDIGIYFFGKLIFVSMIGPFPLNISPFIHNSISFIPFFIGVILRVQSFHFFLSFGVPNRGIIIILIRFFISDGAS